MSVRTIRSLALLAALLAAAGQVRAMPMLSASEGAACVREADVLADALRRIREEGPRLDAEGEALRAAYAALSARRDANRRWDAGGRATLDAESGSLDRRDRDFALRQTAHEQARSAYVAAAADYGRRCAGRQYVVERQPPR